MDARLQHLRRAWQASGSIADEAAYLQERVRVGDLSTERLELGAYCGHAAAAEAARGVEPSVEGHSLRSAIRRVGRVDRAGVVAGVFAVIETVASTQSNSRPVGAAVAAGATWAAAQTQYTGDSLRARINEAWTQHSTEQSARPSDYFLSQALLHLGYVFDPDDDFALTCAYRSVRGLLSRGFSDESTARRSFAAGVARWALLGPALSQA